jgi:phosphoglycolate phosphatase-like HAD superfamily hydrolase
MWDIDLTLLYAGGVAQLAYEAAFLALFGAPPRLKLRFSGRTDLDMMSEALAHHGVTDPDLSGFFARYATEFTARAHLLPERGYPLPGAAQVLAALAGRPDLVQTSVTGNIAPVAHAKLAAFDLAALLDLTVGGYGDEHAVRAELVSASHRRARHRYGDFAEVVVIGDTVHDIAAALACGCTAVGVATGPASIDELRAAGAHHVLDSLVDVQTVVDLLSSWSARRQRERE